MDPISVNDMGLGDAFVHGYGWLAVLAGLVPPIVQRIVWKETNPTFVISVLGGYIFLGILLYLSIGLTFTTLNAHRIDDLPAATRTGVEVVHTALLYLPFLYTSSLLGFTALGRKHRIAVAALGLVMLAVAGPAWFFGLLFMGCRYWTSCPF